MTYSKYISEIVDLMYLHICIINNISLRINLLVKYSFIETRTYVCMYVAKSLFNEN